MKLTHTVSVLAMSVALLGGFAAPAFADVPKAPADVGVIDTNKDGRIDKVEFLAYMGASFDELAGANGYCTFEEVEEGFRRLHQMITP